MYSIFLSYDLMAQLMRYSFQPEVYVYDMMSWPKQGPKRDRMSSERLRLDHTDAGVGREDKSEPNPNNQSCSKLDKSDLS